MKIKKYCFLIIPQLLIFYSVFSQKDTTNFNTFQVTFEDGTNALVSVKDYSPNNHPSNLIGFNLFDFRLNEKGALGPFVLEPTFTHFSEDRKIVLNGRFLFTPLDYKLLENITGKFNFHRMELELGGNFVFKEKVEFVSTKLNFLKDNVLDTIYRIEAKWPELHQINVRGGIFAFQRSLREMKIDTVLVNNVENFQRTDFQGLKQLMMFVGISKIKKQVIDCSTDQFGDYKGFRIREIYLDFLFSPVRSVYGQIYQYPVVGSGSVNYNNVVSEGVIKNHGLTNSPFGIRLGGYKKGTLAKNSKFGTSLGYEIGYYPGINGYRFEFAVLKFGFLFF